MATIHGVCDRRFTGMKEVLSNNLDSGADLGASVAVMLDGKMIVDMWGGWSDPEKTKPWAEDTITNVWSSTKTMTYLSALVLIDRGDLDPFAPVSKYWPEFAQNGKAGVEVRHLMSHTSGVSAWAQPVVVEDIYDWEKSTSMLARQEPWWEPGTGSGYHALNQGHLVGEVIRRITGLRLGKFFAKEVAGPLKADFHIGLDPSQFHRVSNVVPPPPLDMAGPAVDPNSVAFKTFTGPAPDAAVSWTPGWRQADIGAANGHGNARSVAKLQAIVSNGGEVDGVRLLSEKTCDLIFTQQSNGMDLVIGVPERFGIGYGLASPETLPYVPAENRVCFWGGWGGSVVINDLTSRMTIAYMMNRMESGVVGDYRGEALVRAAYSAIANARAAV